MVNSNIPLIVTRLVFINQAARSQDHPYDDFNTVLLTELHVNLAVILSCAPFLKLVMHSLQTGWITSDSRVFRGRASSIPAGIDCERPGYESQILGANFGRRGWTEPGGKIQRDVAITISGEAVNIRRDTLPANADGY